jgi:hypothetical protein
VCLAGALKSIAAMGMGAGGVVAHDRLRPTVTGAP